MAQNPKSRHVCRMVYQLPVSQHLPLFLGRDHCYQFFVYCSRDLLPLERQMACWPISSTPPTVFYTFLVPLTNILGNPSVSVHPFLLHSLQWLGRSPISEIVIIYFEWCIWALSSSELRGWDARSLGSGSSGHLVLCKLPIQRHSVWLQPRGNNEGKAMCVWHTLDAQSLC